MAFTNVIQGINNSGKAGKEAEIVILDETQLAAAPGRCGTADGNKIKAAYIVFQLPANEPLNPPHAICAELDAVGVRYEQGIKGGEHYYITLTHAQAEKLVEEMKKTTLATDKGAADKLNAALQARIRKNPLSNPAPTQPMAAPTTRYNLLQESCQYAIQKVVKAQGWRAEPMPAGGGMTISKGKAKVEIKHNMIGMDATVESYAMAAQLAKELIKNAETSGQPIHGMTLTHPTNDIAELTKMTEAYLNAGIRVNYHPEALFEQVKARLNPTHQPTLQQGRDYIKQKLEVPRPNNDPMKGAVKPDSTDSGAGGGPRP
jgi:hypothetical protein